MKKTTTILAATAMLLAAGCSSDDDSGVPAAVESVPVDADASSSPTAEPEPPAVSTSEPEAEPTPETSQRGNLIKELGETAWLAYSPTNDDAWFELQITDIEVGGTEDCNVDQPNSPEHGHFLFATVVLSTASEWPPEVQGFPILFYPEQFSVINAEGVTENDIAGSAYYCLDASDTITEIGPGENATGTVVLDVSTDSGVLVYRPFSGEPGWEWEF